MSKTATHVEQPARHRVWGLIVDSLPRPAEFVVIRYPSEGRRHSEPFTEVMRLPYIENADAAVAALVYRAAMPKPTAVSLVMAVSAKIQSAKLRRAV